MRFDVSVTGEGVICIIFFAEIELCNVNAVIINGNTIDKDHKVNDEKDTSKHFNVLR
jgi:hypothetical protein